MGVLGASQDRSLDFSPYMSGFGIGIMNPGEMSLNASTHRLLDRAVWELTSSQFFTKLYFCWEVDLRQQMLGQGQA